MKYEYGLLLLQGIELAQNSVVKICEIGTEYGF